MDGSLRLAGRSAIITGSSRGLGLEIARHYVRAGANVLLNGRDPDVLEDARRDVNCHRRKHQRVVAVAGDVSRPEDVDKLLSTALAEFPNLEILVNNAGVYGPLGVVDQVSWSDWAAAVEINLMGSVYCCRGVLPHMRQRGYGKIIQLSGGGATAPLPRISAYAASKAGIVRFIETLAQECAQQGIDANCIAPGALRTRLNETAVAAGPQAIGTSLHEKLSRVMDEGGTPLETGASLAVYLGSADSDGVTGRLLSAVWDPWETLRDHRDDLASSDVYTLRRITPDERGFSWGERGR